MRKFKTPTYNELVENISQAFPWNYKDYNVKDKKFHYLLKIVSSAKYLHFLPITIPKAEN